MSEIISDQWGIMASKVHADKLSYSTREARYMLVDSWNVLCGTTDEGIHPSGEFRMNVLLGTNPDLRKSLDCQNLEQESKKIISCTFDGESTI